MMRKAWCSVATQQALFRKFGIGWSILIWAITIGPSPRILHHSEVGVNGFSQIDFVEEQ
jgi:hypothetical protein|tara:strand:- start:1152 stop:1328 length:177 start_codon:yes stop_codon:yes gene_type:complete